VYWIWNDMIRVGKVIIYEELKVEIQMWKSEGNTHVTKSKIEGIIVIVCHMAA
jgi:hypothetical protein